MKGKCNNKWCCYLYGLLDLVCFVGGAYLLSAAIFGGCCGAATCNCGVLGLPLIVLGFVIRGWTGRGCCCSCGTKKCCAPSSTEPDTTD